MLEQLCSVLKVDRLRKFLFKMGLLTENDRKEKTGTDIDHNIFSTEYIFLMISVFDQVFQRQASFSYSSSGISSIARKLEFSTIAQCPANVCGNCKLA